MNSFDSPASFVKKNWIQCLVLIFASFALYFQVIKHDYILDDKIVISENTLVQKGIKGIPDLLKYDSFYGHFQKKIDLLEGGRYRPLSLVTFAVEYELWGLSPVMGHIVNLLLYGFVGISLFLLFTWFQQRYNLSGSPWFSLSFIAALLFIFHPIHTEAVINIKSRDEILALLLSVSSLLSFIYADFKQKRGKWFWYMSGGILYFLALLAKENAITFLVVIPVTLYFMKKERNIRELVAPTIVVTVFTIAYLYLRHTVIGGTVSSSEITNPLNNPFYGFSELQVWGTILYTLEKYVELLIYPVNLSHDYYPYAIPVADFSFVRVWLSILFYLGLAAVSIYGLFKRSLLAWAAIFYLVTISVVSNVFVIIGTTMNERFIFMSSVAFSLVTAYFLYRLHKWRKYLGVGLLGLILIFYGYQTLKRAPDWGSYVSLNKSAVEHAPNSARSHLFYGTALFNEASNLNSRDEQIKNYREALVQFKKAQAIFREYGTEVTRNFKYFDAVKMQSGTIAQLYSLGDADLSEMLTEFKDVLSKNPRNEYTRKFLQYINQQLSGNPLLSQFYRDITRTIMIPYGQQIDRSYYNTAITYAEMGLSVAPNDEVLLSYLAQLYSAIGRPELMEKYQR